MGGGVALAQPANAPSTHGARGAGDPYFPGQGNGGYEVDHYRLRLHYTPSTRMIRGVERIYAHARKDLTRFDLDLRPSMKVATVTVQGAPARFAQPAALKQELVIWPAKMLHKGHRFQVVVHYAGIGKSIRDPDDSLDGWIKTDDGAFVANEPQGTPTWYAVNDTPRDKATYRISVNVPRPLKAIGNGALQSRVRKGSRTIWTWNLTTPISSYLVTATVGRYHLTRGKTPGGVPYLIAVDPTQRAKADPVLKNLPDIIDFFSAKYGAYPFHQAGAIVDNAPNVFYALETATRPIFDRAPSALTLAHELAHQWFGDDVTLKRWRDIWLNEGFAEFSSWLWNGHNGGRTMAQHLRDWLADGTDVNPPPGDPGDAKDIFAGSVYDRGACALQALREKIGGKVFFAIMRGWAHAHAYGNATVPQFIAFAQRVSHRDLHTFFHRWLYRVGKP
jgi:aminopeptidase N